MFLKQRKMCVDEGAYPPFTAYLCVTTLPGIRIHYHLRELQGDSFGTQENANISKTIH